MGASGGDRRVLRSLGPRRRLPDRAVVPDPVAGDLPSLVLPVGRPAAWSRRRRTVTELEAERPVVACVAERSPEPPVAAGPGSPAESA